MIIQHSLNLLDNNSFVTVEHDMGAEIQLREVEELYFPVKNMV